MWKQCWVGNSGICKMLSCWAFFFPPGLLSTLFISDLFLSSEFLYQIPGLLFCTHTESNDKVTHYIRRWLKRRKQRGNLFLILEALALLLPTAKERNHHLRLQQNQLSLTSRVVVERWIFFLTRKNISLAHYFSKNELSICLPLLTRLFSSKKYT